MVVTATVIGTVATCTVLLRKKLCSKLCWIAAVHMGSAHSSVQRLHKANTAAYIVGLRPSSRCSQQTHSAAVYNLTCPGTTSSGRGQGCTRRSSMPCKTAATLLLSAAVQLVVAMYRASVSAVRCSCASKAWKSVPARSSFEILL